MADARYTRAEVVFLRSLSREDAELWESATAGVAHAARRPSPPDARSSMFWNNGLAGSGELPLITGAGDPQPIPLLARWSDVQRAETAVKHRRHEATRAALALSLRSNGFTEREVAEGMGIDRKQLRRQVRSLVDDVLDLLGGEGDDTDRLDFDGPNACLNCGRRPRVKLPARPPEQPEPREAGTCIECISEEIRVLLLLPVEGATHAGRAARGTVLHVTVCEQDPDAGARACCGRSGLAWESLADTPGLAWQVGRRWCALCSQRGSGGA